MWSHYLEVQSGERLSFAELAAWQDLTKNKLHPQWLNVLRDISGMHSTPGQPS